MTGRTFFVPVTFTVTAASPEDAAAAVTEYLDLASRWIDRVEITAVDVEDDAVRAYTPES